jgi:hypothetical protein
MCPGETEGTYGGGSEEDYHLGCDDMYERYDGSYCFHLQDTAGIASQKTVAD